MRGLRLLISASPDYMRGTKIAPTYATGKGARTKHLSPVYHKVGWASRGGKENETHGAEAQEL